MTNAPYMKTIKNVVRQTDIRLLNYMEKTRKFAEKPNFVDYCVFESLLAIPDDESDKQQQKALVKIEMRKFNHFINKPFAKGFCVLENSKQKINETCILLT